MVPTATSTPPKTRQANPEAHGFVLPPETGVVHLVAEYWPYARSGGLAEAVRGIAKHQAESGIPTFIFLPLYGSILRRYPTLEPVGPSFTVPLGLSTEEAQLYEENPAPGGPRVLFIRHDGFFDRPGLYGDDRGDYPDNHFRFAFLARAALEALPMIGEKRYVLHAHDWHTALAPVYLRTVLAGQEPYDQTAAVLTVHNAGYQGHFGPEVLPAVGLPASLQHWSRMEWYGHINWLKGGLVYSDFVGTVSRTHAHELRTPVGGFGLHDAFISLGDRLVGIRNGIDLSVWDPAKDPDIPAHYNRDDLAGKAKCKADLQKAVGLPIDSTVPLFGMTARLVAQKGFDIILGDGLLNRLPAQFIFLGEGDRRYRDALARVANELPDRVVAVFDFTEEREHRLLAGADLLLMPSLYEPCGLTQMRAQVYGALPVVRRVGGLADTVEDQVTGFAFDEYSPAGLERAIRRAIATFEDKEAWREHQMEAMSRDFGWKESSDRYVTIYRRALESHARTA
jgi:starch synthase